MSDTLPFSPSPVVDDDVRSANGDRLRVIPGDLNWVIRFIHPAQYAASPDLLARTRAAHDELPGFGIQPPPRTYIEVEEHPGHGRTVVVATARIHGQSLATAIPEDPAARQAAERIVTDLLRYYTHKFLTHTAYFADMHIAQFMWGTHLHSSSPAAWMIDLDAGAGPFPPDPNPRQIALLHWWIGETANSAIEIETRSGLPVRSYRELLDELEHSPVFADPSAAGRVARMRRAINTATPFDANEEWVQPLLS